MDAAAEPIPLTVVELADRFLASAKGYYVTRDGQPSNENTMCRSALRVPTLADFNADWPPGLACVFVVSASLVPEPCAFLLATLAGLGLVAMYDGLKL